MSAKQKITIGWRVRIVTSIGVEGRLGVIMASDRLNVGAVYCDEDPPLWASRAEARRIANFVRNYLRFSEATRAKVTLVRVVRWVP